MTSLAWRDWRFWFLSVAALATAAALLVPAVKQQRTAYDLVAFVDLTGSMLTRDMGTGTKPETRIEAAKNALRTLITDLPCQSRLGLGIFAERKSFLFLEPVDVCADFAPLDGAIAALDWRMAWEGDSLVTKGLYHALELLTPMGADVVFMTDGHEAPPLPPGVPPPDYEGEAGKVRGLVVGIGGLAKSPIPRFDEEGRETGSYGHDDVPQENRTGPPPPDAESRPGYHPKWAPFGTEPATGDEHLSSVRAEHLRSVAAKAGLGYVTLIESPRFYPAVAANARARTVVVPVDIRPYAAALALALLAALYLFPLAVTLFGTFNRTMSGDDHSMQQTELPT